MKTAIVIGSTGLVGTELIDLLLKSDEYSHVISFVRRASGVSHPKLTEHIVDFNKPEAWSDLVKGDVLFSTMGTTIKQAKSKENQFRVDYTFQFETAKSAAKNGVPTYVLVSSAQANSKSLNFYTNMKGKLEDDVKKLPFKNIQILQPGQLDGNRKEHRAAEKFGLKVIYKLNSWGLLKRFRPIQGKEVAQAMLSLARKSTSETYKLDELFALAKGY